jgi:hypothetical protein
MAIARTAIPSQHLQRMSPPRHSLQPRSAMVSTQVRHGFAIEHPTPPNNKCHPGDIDCEARTGGGYESGLRNGVRISSGNGRKVALCGTLSGGRPSALPAATRFLSFRLRHLAGHKEKPPDAPRGSPELGCRKPSRGPFHAPPIYPIPPCHRRENHA